MYTLAVAGTVIELSSVKRASAFGQVTSPRRKRWKGLRDFSHRLTNRGNNHTRSLLVSRLACSVVSEACFFLSFIFFLFAIDEWPFVIFNVLLPVVKESSVCVESEWQVASVSPRCKDAKRGRLVTIGSDRLRPATSGVEGSKKERICRDRRTAAVKSASGVWTVHTKCVYATWFLCQRFLVARALFFAGTRRSNSPETTSRCRGLLPRRCNNLVLNFPDIYV